MYCKEFILVTCGFMLWECSLVGKLATKTILCILDFWVYENPKIVLFYLILTYFLLH